MAPNKNNKLNKVNRINQTSDYKQIFLSSCQSIGKEFRVIAKANKLPFARLGLSIAKKKVAQAVARNKLKRVIRESFRCHKDMLKGLDLVVFSRGVQYNKENKERIIYSLNEHWRCISKCSRL